MKFAIEKPASRILVNTQSALGAVGGTNELLPSLTLGPGTIGGSIISENVSAKHLINVKRLVFETRPVNPAKSDVQKFTKPQDSKSTSETKSDKPWIEKIEERLREGAGNIPVWNKSESKQIKPAPPVHSGQKDKSSLGSGISEEEVDRIIREFSKR
jgi:acetaldehyde dehydrogenase (acetylating)